MYARCRKYLWLSANYSEETTEIVGEKELQMNLKVNFGEETFSPLGGAVCGVCVY